MSRVSDEEIIMYDEAAVPIQKTITLWASRDGKKACHEEGVARYTFCTHRPCSECGKPAEKMYTACASCREKNELQRFLKRPREDWDGEQMIYSDATEKFYEDPYSAIEDGRDLDIQPDDMRLILCDPKYARIEEDYFADLLPEDTEVVPAAISKAIDDFNAAALAHGPISWEPGKKALDLSRYVSFHEFTLVLGVVDEIDQKIIDDLYPNCSDATLSSSEGVVYLEFSRIAKSRQDAIDSAIKDVTDAGYSCSLKEEVVSKE